MTKRIIALFLSFIMLLPCMVSLADDVPGTPVKTYVNGKLQEYDVNAFVTNGRTLVPMRGIFEALGATVEWDDSLQKVTAQKDGTIITLVINSDIAEVNGEVKTLDVPAMLVNSRTMVPFRFVGEALGCTVEWDDERQAAFVWDAAKEVIDALKEADALCDKGILEWLASLYDPGTGGFYYSRSARDNEGFLPDVESTYQAVYFMQQTGMIGSGASTKGIIPDKIRDGFAKFAYDMQIDDDGYFYHPQWGRNIPLARKSRDLMWARSLINMFGEGKFKYKLPEERLPEAASQTAADTKAKAATAQYSASDSGYTVTKLSTEADRFSSKEAFLKYLNSFDWEKDGWGSGNTLVAEIDLIRKAGLMQTTADFLASIMNPETGLWGTGLSYAQTNTAMKVSSFFGKETMPYPHIDKMVESVIWIIENEDVPRYITDIWNPIVAINTALGSYETVPAELRAKLDEKLPSLIRALTKNAALFRKEDGAFGYNRTTGQDYGQGVRVSKGANESDVNGTLAACANMRKSLYGLAGVTAPPIFDIYLDWFIELLEKQEPIIKQPIVLPEYVPTMDREYDKNAIGCRDTFENVTEGYLPGGAWSSSVGAGVEKVVIDPTNKKNKALMLSKDTEGVVSASMNVNCGEKPKKIIANLDFMLTEASGSGVFYNKVGQLLEWCIISPDDSGYAISTRFSGSGYGTKITTLSFETWYNLKIEYLPETHLTKIYIDDSLLTTTTEFYNSTAEGATPPETISSLNFATFISGKGSLYIDNVEVEVE